MIPYLKAILFDQGAFIGWARGLMHGLGGIAMGWDALQMPGEAPSWLVWVGVGLQTFALFMRSVVPTGGSGEAPNA